MKMCIYKVDEVVKYGKVIFDEIIGVMNINCGNYKDYGNNKIHKIKLYSLYG
jgi:hypothetical protein